MRWRRKKEKMMTMTALISFECAMIGILGKLLGGVDGLVAVE